MLEIPIYRPFFCSGIILRQLVAHTLKVSQGRNRRAPETDAGVNPKTGPTIEDMSIFCSHSPRLLFDPTSRTATKQTTAVATRRAIDVKVCLARATSTLSKALNGKLKTWRINCTTRELARWDGSAALYATAAAEADKVTDRDKLALDDERCVEISEISERASKNGSSSSSSGSPWALAESVSEAERSWYPSSKEPERSPT